MENNNLADLLAGTQTAKKDAIITQSAAGQSFTQPTLYGDAMNEENVNLVVKDVRPELIVLIGFPDYGKTTFVASLYHILLCEGEVNGFKWVDSDTYAGFERRLYLRRCDDKTVHISSATKRTIRGEGHFLTFYFENDKKERRQLIFSDRSGEDYDEYVNSNKSIKEDRVISNASHLVLFVDSSMLITTDSLMVQTQFEQLLTRMKDNKLLDYGQTIDIIFNKIDKVVDKKSKFDQSRKQLEERIKNITDRGEIKSFDVSSNNVTENQGLRTLLSYFIDPTALESFDSKPLKNKLDWVSIKLKK